MKLLNPTPIPPEISPEEIELQEKIRASDLKSENEELKRLLREIRDNSRDKNLIKRINSVLYPKTTKKNEETDWFMLGKLWKNYIRP